MEKKKFEFAITGNGIDISGTFVATSKDKNKFMNMIFNSSFSGFVCEVEYVCEVEDED